MLSGESFLTRRKGRTTRVSPIHRSATVCARRAGITTFAPVRCVEEIAMATQRIYSTLRRRFSETELIRLGFRHEGSLMVKRGACRALLAEASLSGKAWRVTPYVRYWR